MAAVEILIQIVTRFGEILAAPMKNPDMLWILVPIYLNWIFTDYYQERKGTAFGNAVTNGVVTVWVGMDWIRQSLKDAAVNMALAPKIGISVFFIIYGLVIMIESARAKKIAHYIGRIREVSYFMVVMTPILYKAVVFDWITLAAILLFFPIFYMISEIINRVLPAPPGEEETFGKLPDLGPETSFEQSSAQQGFQQQFQSQYPQQYPPQMPKF